MNVSFLTLGTNRYAASHHSPSRHSRCITALNEYRGIFFFLSQGQEILTDSWRETEAVTRLREPPAGGGPAPIERT